MFNKKGGVELTTVIIIVVLVGALVIGIASALTSDLKNTANTGLVSNKDYLDNIYAQIPSNNEGGDVGGGGNVFPPIIDAEDVLIRNFHFHNVDVALRAIWNKIPDGGFAEADHTHNDATEVNAGFMSVADKIKLNGLTNYIHPDTHPASMITGLSAVATSGNYNDLINRPNSLPANGGNADTVDGKHASDFVKRKKITLENVAYKNFVIPLVSLNNASQYYYYQAYGNLYLYRKNLSNGAVTNIEFACGKKYNSNDVFFEFSKTKIYSSSIDVKPCKFFKDGVPFFGVYVMAANANFTDVEFNGFSTQFDDIDYIAVYDNQNKQILNSEIYNSIEIVEESSYNLPREFSTTPYVNGKKILTQDDYNELFTFVSDGKNTVASAITDKGVPATGSDTFGELADKIRQIPSGGKYPPGYKWTKVIPPAGINVSQIEITYHDGYFQFVQHNEVNKNVSLYKSQNGINWTEEILDIYPSRGSVHRTHLIYGNDKMMVIFSGSYSGKYRLNVYTSTNNGSSWAEKILSKETSLKDSVCFGNNRFVIAGYNFLASSTNGINWTEIKTSNSYDKVIYGGDRFVAVGNYRYATSTDGINWQQGSMHGVYDDVCYGNGKFVAVGQYTSTNKTRYDYIAQSTNGSGWNYSVLNPIGDYDAVSYENGIFVTTGRADPETTCSEYWILISKDGVHWTYIPWNNGTILKDMCYKPGMFLAKGTDDYFYISTESDM